MSSATSSANDRARTNLAFIFLAVLKEPAFGTIPDAYSAHEIKGIE